ncbi:MAG: rubrerythrin [Gammaproteobacteria bacterium]|nr:MAG: rubrerythrin [Gammaproteobacteria bacterium]
MAKKPAPEGGRSYQRLKEMKSLGEILETAMAFEKTARDFYRDLAKKVSKPLRELVEELAQEEVRHYELFKSLKDNPDVQSHIQESIKAPPSDHRFSDYVQIPDLGEHPDDQAVLQYAMGREQAAMEQYSALAEEVPEGPLRDLFRFLAAEELKHKSELEKRYYELVYRGGP